MTMKSFWTVAVILCGLIVGGGSSAQRPKLLNERIAPGQWRSPSGITMRLWPGGVPGGPAIRPAREYSRTATNPKRFAGLPVTGVFNVAEPTLTVFKPARRGRGAAMLVFPGGGFQQLAIDLEGTEACDWLVRLDVTCVLVKYRVPGTNHHYDERCDCGVTPKRLSALEDAQRAVRTVRFRAREWGIDRAKIGVLGFSAGGYLVAQTSNIVAPIYPPRDAIDRVSSRPDAAMALYPGHLCRDHRKLDPGIKVTRATPPTFLLHARDDPTDPVCNTIVYARALRAAGVPTEVHLLASGGHAFGMRPAGHATGQWPSLVEAWLRRLRMI